MIRGRKEIEEKKLLGVNRVADPTKLKPGTFVSLQNWVPGKRYKIKKKRGVEALVSEADLLHPAQCCVPSGPPDEQELEVVCCYEVNAGFGDVGGNHHGMFAYATPDGDFWATISTATGFSIGAYPISSPSQEWYLLKPDVDCTLVDDTASALTLPGGRTADITAGQTPQGGICGKSDEKMYVLSLGHVTPGISGADLAGSGFIGSATGDGWCLFTESRGAVFIYDTSNEGPDMGNVWCKFDDHFYTPGSNGATGAMYLNAYPLDTGGFAATYQDVKIRYTDMIPGWNELTMDKQRGVLHATDSYLYFLLVEPWDGGPLSTRIYRLNRSDLTFVDYFDLSGDPTFNTPWSMHVFSDELIFLIANNGDDTQWNIGYYQPNTLTFGLIGSLDAQCTAAGADLGYGQSGFVYSNNYFYLSYAGFGLGSTNVLKIGPLMDCDGQALWES